MKIQRIEGIDINHFDYRQNYFTVDLHGCESAVARQVMGSRLTECYRSRSSSKLGDNVGRPWSLVWALICLAYDSGLPRTTFWQFVHRHQRENLLLFLPDFLFLVIRLFQAYRTFSRELITPVMRHASTLVSENPTKRNQDGILVTLNYIVLVP